LAHYFKVTSYSELWKSEPPADVEPVHRALVLDSDDAPPEM
jgi:hypothetical protein